MGLTSEAFVRAGLTAKEGKEYAEKIIQNQFVDLRRYLKKPKMEGTITEIPREEYGITTTPSGFKIEEPKFNPFDIKGNIIKFSTLSKKLSEKITTPASGIAGMIITPIDIVTGGAVFTKTVQDIKSPFQILGATPKLHFEKKEIEKNIGQYQKDVEEYNKLTTRQAELNIQYEAGAIDYDEYSEKFQEAKDTIGKIERGKFWEKVEERGGITTIPRLISTSSAPKEQKILALGRGIFVQSALYFTPQYRILKGVELFGSGIEKGYEGDTTGALLETGVGGLLLASGVRTGGGTSWISRNIPKTAKVVRIGVGGTFIGGISVASGYSIYKQTDDISLGITGAVSTFSGLATGGFISSFRKQLTQSEFEKARIEMREKLVKVQKRLATEQTQISRLQTQRYKSNILRGEPGFRADEYGRLTKYKLAPTTTITGFDISKGVKLTAKQETMLAKYYLDTGATKTQT